MVDDGKASELEVQCRGSCFPAVRIVHLMSGALRHSSGIVWISSLPNPPSALYRSPGTRLGSEDCFKTLSYVFCHCAKTFEFCSKISRAFLKILNFLFLSLLLKVYTGASAEKGLNFMIYRQSALSEKKFLRLYFHGTILSMWYYILKWMTSLSSLYSDPPISCTVTMPLRKIQISWQKNFLNEKYLSENCEEHSLKKKVFQELHCFC